MTGKAIRKHSLHEKTAASVLLKLFISSKNQPARVVVKTNAVQLEIALMHTSEERLEDVEG